jgi:hypothetical protein
MALAVVEGQLMFEDADGVAPSRGGLTICRVVVFKGDLTHTRIQSIYTD